MRLLIPSRSPGCESASNFARLFNWFGEINRLARTPGSCRQNRSGAIAMNPRAANSSQVARMSALTPNKFWRTTTAGAGKLAGREKYARNVFTDWPMRWWQLPR